MKILQTEKLLLHRRKKLCNERFFDRVYSYFFNTKEKSQ